MLVLRFSELIIHKKTFNMGIVIETCSKNQYNDI